MKRSVSLCSVFETRTGPSKLYSVPRIVDIEKYVNFRDQWLTETGTTGDKAINEMHHNLQRINQENNVLILGSGGIEEMNLQGW